MTGRGVTIRTRAIALAVGTVVLIAGGLALQALGGPPDVAETLLPLVFAGTGFIIATRASTNPLGWLFLAAGMAMSAGQAGDSLLFVARDRLDSDAVAKTAAIATGWLWFPTLAVLATFCLLLFPDGRLPSRRWRWVARLAGAGVAVATGVMIAAPFFSDLDLLITDPYGELPVPAALEVVIAVAMIAVVIAVIGSITSLIVRWRRATGVPRQQLKWFAAGGVVQLGGIAAGFASHDIATFLQEAATVALPVAATVAITRYRLYDIDRIISRTVLYSVLTLVVVSVYLLVVTTMTALTSPVTGQSSLAVAASTLTAAAAVRPARRRIQTIVDRRFNRAQYDAQRTADAYRARLRDQLDLESIGADLVGTTQSALQPNGSFLWLRQVES